MRKFGSLGAVVLCAAIIVVFAACKAGDGAGSGRGSAAATAGNQNATTANQNTTNANAPAPPADGIQRISVVDAHKAADEGRAVFVDVRGTVEFEKGHIKGSLSMPRGQIAQRKSELPGDKLIILYCA